MVSYTCFVLFLCFHACIARPLLVWDKECFKQLQFPSKEGFATRSQITAGYGENTSGIINLGNQKPSNAEETQTITAGKMKTSCTSKMLHQATPSEIGRTERSTLESTPRKVEENVDSKNSDLVEDVVVMDYTQPHRKPPIHNKET